MRLKRSTVRPRILAEDIETEPIREDWLKLTPKERLARAWKARRQIKDPDRAHDERTLPEL